MEAIDISQELEHQPSQCALVLGSQEFRLRLGLLEHKIRAGMIKI